MEAPMCLIENTENGKLVVNPEAINFLSGINQPVVVVAIVGMYRTGKSYLINKLAGAQRGFNLGCSIQAETKGIWMWCVPHPLKKDHTLVLLDTEGLGDVEKGDSKNDIWIFALALLLSSAMVYNSKGTIDQDAVDKLKFVGELTELIKVKSKDNDEEEQTFSRHFPIFIWAVRDFHLDLKIEGGQVSADDYLENALKLKQPEMSARNMAYNNPRICLRMYFGNRKCFVFDFPTTNKEFLQRLEEVPDDELNINFVKQCKEFCDYTWKNADTKIVNETVIVTGHRFGELATIYTEAVSSSKFVCMEDAAVSLAEKENKAAFKEAMQHYEDKMKTVELPTETLNDFMTLSSQYENEARKVFLKSSFNDKDQQFLQKCMKNIHRKKDEFSAMNEAKSREVCEALIKKHSADFEKALKEGAYHTKGGHAKFKEDLKVIEIKYNVESGKGVKAEEVLQKFRKSQQSSEIMIIQKDNALNQKQKEEEEQNMVKKIMAIEEKLQKLQETIKEQKMEDERNNVKMVVEKMEKENRILREKLKKVLRQKERSQQLFMDQGLPRHANMYREQFKDLQQSDSIWYKPILDTAKEVAVAVIPLLLEKGGTVLKEKTEAKKSEAEMPPSQNQRLYMNKNMTDDSTGAARVSAPREHFVDKHRLALIGSISPVQPILEELRSLDLLTNEQYETALSKNTPQEKMRELYRYIIHWGNGNKEKVYKILWKHNRPVIEKLEAQ